jgi:uncharacterized protein YyaL (SSP411 family)
LHLQKKPDDLAIELGIAVDELNRCIARIRAALFDPRNQRVRPHKDDKILTDWNGLMIAALAAGAQAFDRPDYANAAASAADFIMANMRTPEGRLLHRYRDGQAAMPASIDDYSFFIWGLLNLYEATFDILYLRNAFELNSVALERFWDDKDGAFHFAADDSEELPVRAKEVYDGAVPSGNSVAALNLVRLGRISGDTEYEAKAEKIVNAFAGQVRRTPQAFTMLLTAFDFALGPTFEIVIVGKPGADDTHRMFTALRRKYIPNKVVIFRPEQRALPQIVNYAEFVREQKTIGGRATAYVCRRFACDMPTTDIDRMLALLDKSDADRQQ